MSKRVTVILNDDELQMLEVVRACLLGRPSKSAAVRASIWALHFLVETEGGAAVAKLVLAAKNKQVGLPDRLDKTM